MGFGIDPTSKHECMTLWPRDRNTTDFGGLELVENKEMWVTTEWPGSLSGSLRGEGFLRQAISSFLAKE